MRLGLSSAAAPGASVAELVAACAARGLAALEIVVAADADVEALAHEITEADGARTTIAGLLSHHSGNAAALAALSRAADAPVLVADACTLNERIALARAIGGYGGDAHVLVSGPIESWLDTVRTQQVRFAWQVDHTCAHPADDAGLILDGSTIGYVRLVGGGPEAAMQEGQGIGALMRRLTLAGCNAPLILTPSSPSYRLAWATWLGRRGGWGCGGKAEETHTLIPIHSGIA